MCMHVEAMQGTCVELCNVVHGCSAEEETCAEFNDRALPICLPSCDPLESECGEGFGCYPGSEGDFVCMREGVAAFVDGVMHPECPAGQFQLVDKTLDCTPDAPCCVPYCDTSESLPCGFDVPCVPFFDEPDPEHPNLGYCGG